jgi:hypothetical protein
MRGNERTRTLGPRLMSVEGVCSDALWSCSSGSLAYGVRRRNGDLLIYDERWEQVVVSSDPARGAETDAFNFAHDTVTLPTSSSI